MQVLLLPGHSTKNIEERDAITTALEADGHSVISHEWRHWKNSSTEFSLEEELSRITRMLAAAGGEETLAVVGKSIGAFVAAALLSQFESHAAHTTRLILLGIPIEAAGERERAHLREALSALKIPITVCQNTADPYGSADAVQNFFEGIPVEFLTREAENHRYAYGELIRDILRSSSS
ncbi:MAG: alpha/beta family hydrolase [Spirochaetaceae bacterium]